MNIFAFYKDINGELTTTSFIETRAKDNSKDITITNIGSKDMPLFNIKGNIIDANIVCTYEEFVSILLDLPNDTCCFINNISGPQLKIILNILKDTLLNKKKNEALSEIANQEIEDMKKTIKALKHVK